MIGPIVPPLQNPETKRSEMPLLPGLASSRRTDLLSRGSARTPFEPFKWHFNISRWSHSVKP
jgi:hypothetical protein